MIQESNRIEFKRVLNDKMEKEIVAFLNNRVGGILYIGLDDQGHPVGSMDLDSTQLKIADRIKNNILPSPLGLFDIVTEFVEDVPVIKILVSSGLEKPYYIKSQGMSPNGCYTRIGSSSQPMTTAMIDDLYAKRIHSTLRNIPSPRQDLKFAQLKIYYQECGLELNQNFANSLELLTPEGKYNYIAYLLADENGVSIKVAKYAGKDKVDLIENEEYGYCSLIKATLSVLDKMKIENVTYAKVTSSKRVEKNLVNPVAMREAIVNCIVHNDFTHEIPPVFEIFSDRIGMTSYGGLIPGQSMEDFFSCSSMPRNRELMRVFKDVGLVEQLGSGMSRILRVYDRDIFQISDHFVKVIFWYTDEITSDDIVRGDDKDAIGDDSGIDGDDKDTIGDDKDANGDDNGANGDDNGANGDDNGANGDDNDIDVEEQKVLTLLETYPEITAKELSIRSSLSTRKISRIMKKLRESGKITRIGSDRKGFWQIHK